jgi:hypothetical protein
MAKDAKGHGSEARGGRGGVSNADLAAHNKIVRDQWAGQPQPQADAHAAGINAVGKAPMTPDINHPIYNTTQKAPGYTGKISPLNADYSTSGSMLRNRISDMTKEDHKAAGDTHVQQSMAIRAEHGKLVDSAMNKLGMQSPGPLISGIVSDKFSEGDKNRLRDLAGGASNHTSAAFAHYAASGIRLPTARARYQGLKG